MQLDLSNHHCLGAAILGVLSHVIFFIRGEWHMRGYLLTKIYVAITIALLYAEYRYRSSPSAAFQAAGKIAGSYVASLFISMTIYRKCFHRLRHFPGPTAASVTKFWHLWKCPGGKNHLLLEQLSKEYGSFIRTGPEELTIIDPTIVSLIDGPKSQCTKAVWYDIFFPQVALNTTRITDDHANRRRIWDRGFSPAALATYEERIVLYADLLSFRIEGLVREQSPIGIHRHNEAAVNVTEWLSWFAFDVMGEIAFGKSFGMLHNGKWHMNTRLSVDAMDMLGPISPAPWIARIVLDIAPWLPVVRDWFSMLQWCRDCMGERLSKKEAKSSDISHWLIEAFKKDLPTSNRQWLDGDAVTMVVAGSGTVAVALIFAFYELARNPPEQDRLLSELKKIDIRDKVQLQKCAHLTAVIQETLRLYPPVPTGGYRVTPPSGLFLNGTCIPGNITVVTPKYSIGRLASCYESPERFVPERWTQKKEMIYNGQGFAPFSGGKFGCIGKSLAMSEMRLVIALLVTKFKISFSENEKGETFLTELRDQFTFAPGELKLMFSIRS
ncbi:hypothetical protein NUW58_g3261 [Xylaria curta]|uniref:Uncharacterized protein n=1 Tax=Xylaria curta TaxID=42375 RepID=A0ACC1PE48_9PEZI|nr:hypothetical protein NUW58_g3261 [Xylaria curta]